MASNHESSPLIRPVDPEDHYHHDHHHMKANRNTTMALVFRVATMVILVSVFFMAIYLVVKEVKRDNSSSSSTTTPVVYSSAFTEMASHANSMMDYSADPCNDFYQYACGSFVSNTPMPDGTSMYIPTFNIIQDNNDIIIQKIIDGQWPLIGDLYASCTEDPSYVYQDTLATMQPVLNKIDTLASLNGSDLLPMLASLHVVGVNAFFTPGVQENIFDTATTPLNHLTFNLGGVTSGYNYNSSDDYLNLVGFATAYMSLFYPNASSLTEATNIINLEANLFWIIPEINDIEDAYINMTHAEFEALSPLDYDPYLSALGLSSTVTASTTVIVSVPGFFRNLAGVIENTPLQTVKYYLGWRLFVTMSGYGVFAGAAGESFATPETIMAAHKPTGGPIKAAVHKKIGETLAARMPEAIVNGARINAHTSSYTPTPQQDAQCVASVTNLLGDFIGLLFSTQIVDDNVRWAIGNMTSGIENSFASGLDQLTWISDSSKLLALNKLRQIIQIIGHPNNLNRYRGVVLSQTSYASNILELTESLYVDMLSTVETPFLRQNYEFPATIVNAFYSPLTNTINFPAGILNSPMFSTSLPVMFMYARMGYVVGHEMTHGFDNNGRMWGPTGMYGDWMDATSSDNFNTQAQCIIDQYSAFSVNGVHVRGEQTLGENIADLGGAKNAFRAYQAWVKGHGAEFPDNTLVKGLTNDQLFWVLLGQTWCTLATDVALEMQIFFDVHSPSKFRVNGPLANIDEFATSFNCPVGSNMNPKDKCLVW